MKKKGKEKVLRDGSKELHIVWSSDFHIGLKTDEIDRTTEIVKILTRIIKYCVTLQKKNKDVILIFGGDIFHTNNPSEEHITSFIGIMNLIKKFNIETYILVGNHDYIAQPGRLSCLSFVRKAKVGYPSINLIDDITYMEIGTFENGPLHFTMLPHIGKATLVGKKIPEGTTTQEYIESKCSRIIGKVGPASQHYAFSHLNVKGAHGGSEANLLRKSEAYLPECFVNVPTGFITPEIIQGHIHCLDEECELLLSDGSWAKYDEISEHDSCYGMNMDTGNLERTKVLELIKSEYSGTMIKSTGYLDYMMTPNHRVLYSSDDKNMKLTPFDAIQDKVLKIPVCGQLEDKIRDQFEVEIWYLRLMVWVFADGSWGKWNGKTNAIRFRFKKKRKVTRLKSVLDKLEVIYTYTERKDGSFNFNISTKQQIDSTVSSIIGVLGDSKELPEFLTRLNKKQSEKFIDELAVTDGNYVNNNKNWVQYSTTSVKSRDIIQTVCVKNNIKCGWWETKSCKGHFGMSINRNRVAVETHINKYEKVLYDGDVWCVRNKLGNFVARKNGKVFITGNSKQKIDNINIVGSPLYVSFGEAETDKYFLDIVVSNSMGTKDKLRYLPTNCTPFESLEVDMVDETKDFMDVPEVKDFLDSLNPEQSPVVKFDVTINPENNTYDWKAIRKTIAETYNYHVKTIVPRVIMRRTVRSVAQKINLSPDSAIKVYLKKNMKRDKTKMKKLYALSKKYLGDQ